MKGLIRSYLITLTALYLVTRIISSFSYAGGYQTLLLGTLVLMLINMIIKPIAKIFFLPINFLTLGLFSFVINALMLYTLTILLPQFNIQSYFFPGFNNFGFVIPAIRFSLIATYVIVSIIISVIISFLNWLKR